VIGQSARENIFDGPSSIKAVTLKLISTRIHDEVISTLEMVEADLFKFYHLCSQLK